MNKRIVFFLIALLVFSGCSPTATSEGETQSPITTEAPTGPLVPVEVATVTETPTPVTIENVIEYEMKGSFDFFWEQANTDPDSPGYGLIRDRYPGSEGIASIASVGFGLTAYIVGVEKGYISYQEAYDRANGTLDTLLAMDRVEGFFFHFVNIRTGKRAWNSEVSNIDTSILMMGVLSAGQYFGGEIQEKAQQLYGDVNWPWFVDETRDMFYMAYRPEEGFAGHWDFYAEQLMMYIRNLTPSVMSHMNCHSERSEESLLQTGRFFGHPGRIPSE